jgi:hypothetical protein
MALRRRCLWRARATKSCLWIEPLSERHRARPFNSQARVWTKDFFNYNYDQLVTELALVKDQLGKLLGDQGVSRRCIEHDL